MPNVGDRIKITIYDIGNGFAKVLNNTNTHLEIEIEEDTWSSCYSNQVLISNILSVKIDEISEVIVC